jgi:predicted ATPase
MLKNIQLKNYKAYQEAKLELKPITILLGTNSSGKTSLLQLILMIEQTINNETSYKSALKLNGKNVSLGETENIFRNKNTNEKLSFSFGIESSKISFHLHSLRRLKSQIESEITDIYLELRQLVQLNNSNKKNTNYGYSDFKIEDVKSLVLEIKKLKRKFSKINFEKLEPFNEYKGKTLLKNKFLKITKDYQNLLVIDINQMFETYKLVKSISNEKSRQITLSYEIGFSSKTSLLEIQKIAIKSNNKILIEFKIQTNKGQKKFLLSSDVFDDKILSKYRVRFGKNIHFDKFNLKSNSEKDNKYPRISGNKIENEFFCSYLVRIFNSFTYNLKITFDNERINYVSPLRAYPKRYYFLDESNVSNSLDSIDGDSLTKILKQDTNIINSVNKWLNNFGLAVDVEDVKEVIHRLKVKQNGLNLDITDVGFGISQVLPIIVQGFLSKKDSLTIIEQPEIHLHPKMQAELADLFIDVVKDDNKNSDKVLLIETHSESILKRLRRRIAEKEISNNDVAIYFIHGKNKINHSATIERLEITETGAFNWPKEFYSTDLEDTKEYLKHQ